jgi:hypothetical protein
VYGERRLEPLESVAVSGHLAAIIPNGYVPVNESG